MSSVVALTDATGGERNLFGRSEPRDGSSPAQKQLRSGFSRPMRRLRPDHCRANPRCVVAHRL